MGLYINPPDLPKEAWIVAYATPTDFDQIDGEKNFRRLITNGLVPLILIHNSPKISVIGIGYSSREIAEWRILSLSLRKKSFWTIPIVELYEEHTGLNHAILRQYFGTP